MKRIKINTIKYGNIVNTEIYLVDNIDSIIIDKIHDYLSLKQANAILNNSHEVYTVVTENADCMNRYDLYNLFVHKEQYEKGINNKIKYRLEKLQKHADKYAKR